MNGLAAALLGGGQSYLNYRGRANDAAVEQGRYDDQQARYADQQQRQQRQDAMAQEMQVASLGAMRDTAARNASLDQRQAAGDARSDYEGGYRAAPDVAALGSAMTAPGAQQTAGWDGTDMTSVLHGMAQMGADLQQQAQGPAAFTRGGVGMVKSGESLDDIARNETQDFKRESLAAQLAAKRESDQQHGADALERAQLQAATTAEGRRQHNEFMGSLAQDRFNLTKKNSDDREIGRLTTAYKGDLTVQRSAPRADLLKQMGAALEMKDNPMAMNAAITDLAKFSDVRAVAGATKTKDITKGMSLAEAAGQWVNHAKTGSPLSARQVENMRQIMDAEIEVGRSQVNPILANYGRTVRSRGLSPEDSSVIAPNPWASLKTRAEQAAENPNTQKLLRPQGQLYGRPPQNAPQQNAPPSPLTPKAPLASYWVKQP